MFLKNINLNEIFICSQVILEINTKLQGDEVKVVAQKALGNKCDRCWKVLFEVSEVNKLCHRCEKVLDKMIK